MNPTSTSGLGSGRTNSISQNESLLTRKKDAEDKTKVKDTITVHDGVKPVRRTAVQTEINANSEEALDTRTGQNRDIQERRVETGHIKIMQPRELSLVAENMPVWILAMEKDYCTTIHVVAHSSPGKFLKTMRQKNIDPHLVNIAVARLGLSRIHYLGTDPPPHKSVLLVSGSVDFLRRTTSTDLFLALALAMTFFTPCSAILTQRYGKSIRQFWLIFA
jgi:hypothetical protein